MYQKLKYTSIDFRFSLMKLMVVIVSIMIWPACHKSDIVSTGSLKLTFDSHYGPLLFTALQPYGYAGNQSIKFSKFDFYITGVQLVNSKETINAGAHALIDLTAPDNSMNITDVKAGDYQTLRLSIGVTSDLNKKLPKDFGSTDALSNTSHYWDAWNSYIFSKMEGVLDTSGLKTFDLGFAVHTGTDACLQNLTLSKLITINNKEETVIHLDIDIRKVFSVSGQFFDLIQSPLNHNPTNLETLKSFSDRLAAAIQLKI